MSQNLNTLVMYQIHILSQIWDDGMGLYLTEGYNRVKSFASIWSLLYEVKANWLIN